jgi:hypothetical protein
MNRTKKWILFAVFLTGLALAFGLVQYFEPARDHGDQSVLMTLSAEDLLDMYSSGNTEGSVRIGEVIAVRGTVKSSGASALVIHPGISCSMADPWSPSDDWIGKEVTVKGRLVGFDALFGEVQLDYVSFYP